MFVTLVKSRMQRALPYTARQLACSSYHTHAILTVNHSDHSAKDTAKSTDTSQSTSFSYIKGKATSMVDHLVSKEKLQEIGEEVEERLGYPTRSVQGESIQKGIRARKHAHDDMKQYDNKESDVSKKQKDCGSDRESG
jgi:hypothetical protein